MAGVRPAWSFATHSSSGWSAPRRPTSSPRRTISRSVNVRGHTWGTWTATSRTCSAAAATEPLAMMDEVTAAAADNAGPGAALLARVESIRVIDTLAWRYPNPGALLASRLGIPLRDSVKVATGGNSPQMAVND